MGPPMRATKKSQMMALHWRIMEWRTSGWYLRINAITWRNLAVPRPNYTQILQIVSR